jgi:tRNA threonylcarbamoyladenosine biosynthesis protein TsaE
MNRPERPADTDFNRLNIHLQNSLWTIDVGRLLGAVINEGLVITLSGQLGAGKTTFTHGLLEGLGGSSEDVSSPTFTLIHEYQADRPVYHLDTYRLKSQAEFLDLGIDELMTADAVVIIEWPELVASLLPEDRLIIEITHTAEASRQLSAQASGPHSREIIARWKTAVMDSNFQAETD